MTIENAAPFFAWDVSTYLFFALSIAFVIVLIDRLFFASQADAAQVERTKPAPLWQKIPYFLLFLKTTKAQTYHHRPKIVQWSAEFFPVLLLVFFLRGFVVEPFRIPSNSMMPTLLTGDFVVVNKFIYGLRLPVLNTRLVEISNPKRGDVIVFRYPNYEQHPTYQGTDFIKRIIGLPGDTITYSADNLIVNDKKIRANDLGIYQGLESGVEMTGFIHKLELLDDNPHTILLDPKRTSKAVKLVVPAGHYFVMGDNRARSSDSRFWGFVPEEYIIGKAFGVWMHWDETIKLERIGAID